MVSLAFMCSLRERFHLPSLWWMMHGCRCGWSGPALAPGRGGGRSQSTVAERSSKQPSVEREAAHVQRA